MKSRAAVFLSRQSLHPCSKNKWVRQTKAAIEWIRENNLILCSSAGMSTWELITALGSRYKIDIELFLPFDPKEDFDRVKAYYQKQFNLNEKQTSFIPVNLRQETVSKEKLWQLRDSTIAEQADIILPVSIRNNGGLDKLCRSSMTSGKQINLNFKTPHEQKKKKLGYKIKTDLINQKTDEVCCDYLIHWTRSFNSAWPDERLIDYYLAVIEADIYPRSAFETLKKIIRQKNIIASHKNMPENIPAVSFTSQSLYKMIELIRWRSRYKQMSFEPYGIGIKKDVAEQLGIQKVEYFDKKKQTDEIPEDNWLTQSRGLITDWRDEMEYRLKGDCNLSGIPKDDLILITRYEKEAEILASETEIRSLSFTIE